MIVSYGGRGGGKANGQLRQVLKGLRMSEWEGGLELVINVEHRTRDENEDIDKETAERWEAEGLKDDLVRIWRELSAEC